MSSQSTMVIFRIEMRRRKKKIYFCSLFSVDTHINDYKRGGTSIPFQTQNFFFFLPTTTTVCHIPFFFKDTLQTQETCSFY